MKLSWPDWKISKLFGKAKRPAPPQRPTRAPRPLGTVHRARARAVAEMEEDDYDEDAPTTRLSTAFFVVVALHVVAVGGIYAFNSIKAGRASTAGTSTGSRKDAKAATPAPERPAARSTGSQILPVAGTTVHKVRDGETLGSIAAEHHVSVAELAELNGLDVNSSLRSVKVLNVPVPKNPPAPANRATETKPKAPEPVKATPAKAAAPAEVKKTTPAKATPARPATHTVSKGETLSRIAKKYGVTQAELVKLNSLKNPEALKIGQSIKLPPK